MRFDPRDYDDDSRGRDSDDARSLGRGPGNDRQTTDTQDDASRDYARWADRERDDSRGDTRQDAFTRNLALPRGPERDRVMCGERIYTPRGSEVRTLATVGAFRHEPRPSRSGAEWNREQLQRIDLRRHDLRHGGACRLLADGVDIRVIQLMLGHESIQQTQRYLNVTDEELRRGFGVSWSRQGRPLRLASGG